MTTSKQSVQRNRTYVIHSLDTVKDWANQTVDTTAAIARLFHNEPYKSTILDVEATT